MKKISKIRLFWLVFLSFLVFIFLCLGVVPFGRITYHYHWPRGLASGKGFISDFKPAERIDVSAKDSLKIVADPVYFSLFTPRRFDKARVTVEYRRELSPTTPIIELGLLQDKVSNQYELRPLENRTLDNLRFDWARLADEEGLLVLQADRYYQTKDDFFRDLKNGRLANCANGVTNCLALYNYQFNPVFSLPNYRAPFPISIKQPLRGAHQAYVYFPNGSWHLAFSFLDLNQDKGADPITVILRSDSGIVKSETLPDANLDPTGGQSEERSLSWQGDELPAGAYKIEIKVSDDIVTKEIESSSAKLVFLNHLWPVSSPHLPLTIITDGSSLLAQTINPASLGDIAFGSYRLPLTSAYRQFSTAATDGRAVRDVTISKDDIVLETNGVFSLSSDSFFDPSIQKVDRYFRPGDQIKYIIAGYESPRGDRKKHSATAEFDLRNASREKGKYTFIISIPGLALSEGQTTTSAADYLEIKDIRIQLQGKTLWQKIFRK